MGKILIAALIVGGAVAVVMKSFLEGSETKKLPLTGNN